MRVNLKVITPNAEKTVVEIARVSSSREDKTAEVEKLINYLIKHKHWSPFEHGHMTVEIETSKAIGIQLLRHRSFTFQEFSQRYQDVSKLGDMFEDVELRKQATDNRQSSTEVINPILEESIFSNGAWRDREASKVVRHLMEEAGALYETLLEKGVAREQARMILPMCTKTRIYMTGSIRSWIHFLDIRDDGHAQKEIQEVAKEIKKIFVRELPIISKALVYSE